MNVTLRQLRVFLMAAETRHFRLAAERLHLTQPAVSRHIAELENQLGMTLFDRNTRGIHLTPAGLRLRGSVARVLDELDAMLARARTEGEGLRGTVRVAAGPTPSAELMPGCIANCAALYPDITLICRDRIQSEVIDAVRAGEVDFGLAIDPPETRELATETILQDPFVLVCRPDDPLARLRRVPWKRLAGAPLVLMDHTSGSRRLIDAILAEHGVAPCVVQETGHTHTAFRMVEAGLGSSITVSLSAPRSTRLVTLPLTPPVARAVTLVRRRHHSLSPAAQRIWEWLGDLERHRGRGTLESAHTGDGHEGHAQLRFRRKDRSRST